MEEIQFHESDVRNKNLIVINSEHPEELDILVTSPFTGVTKEFFFDYNFQCDMEMKHEGWDGEEKHKYYRCYDQGRDIIIDFWHSTHYPAVAYY